MFRSDNTYFHYIMPFNDNNRKAPVQIELSGTRY